MKFSGFSVVFLFAILAVTFAALSDEKREKIKKKHQECQEDPATQVPEDLLKKSEVDELDAADKEKLGKHLLCMNKKMGVQKENGDIDVDKLKSEMEEDIGDKTKAEAVAKDCGTRAAGTTAEEAARALSKCIFSHLGIAPIHHH